MPSSSLSTFAPQAWNNADYKITLDDGRLYLRAEQPHSLDIRVTGTPLDGTVPKAQLFHSSGRESNGEFATERSGDNGKSEVTLTDIEAQVLRSMVRRTSFSCPHCGENHTSHTLHCVNDLSPRFRFQGRPILASLHDVRRKGLFLCSDDGARVRCEFAGQSWLDGDRRHVYFALDGQSLCSAALSERRVDWKTVRRIQGNCFQLRERRYVVVYH